MRIAGIDLSTHAVDIVTVAVDVTREPPYWHRYPLEGADSFARARQVRDAMLSRTDEFWDDILAIGIEDPAGHHGTNHIYRIQGAVLQCLPSLVLVQQWRPAAWRKAVGLPGNCAKDRVTLFAHQEIRQAQIDQHALRTWPWPQDACDAYCIALATRQAIHVGAAA